jgi:hypothetical protein
MPDETVVLITGASFGVGASSHRASDFEAPSGSPAASARAAQDQRVHRNPVTLVTLTVRDLGAILADHQQRAIDVKRESKTRSTSIMRRKEQMMKGHAKEGDEDDD